MQALYIKMITYENMEDIEKTQFKTHAYAHLSAHNYVSTLKHVSQ